MIKKLFIILLIITGIARDVWPEKSSFNVLSPSGTKETIASDTSSGTYTVTSNRFYGESAKGQRRLWIENSYGGGTCKAIIDDQLLRNALKISSSFFNIC